MEKEGKEVVYTFVSVTKDGHTVLSYAKGSKEIEDFLKSVGAK